MDKRWKTKEQVLKEFTCVHGDLYDYSKFEYIGTKKKSCIICKKCNKEFWQTPDNHKSKKQGCPYCNGNNKLTNKEYIIKASLVHNNKYKYPNLLYINTKEKIAIECPIHGEFEQIALIHLYQKRGCPKCAGNHKYSNNEFIEECVKIRGNEYDYTNTKYINSKTQIIITCKKHGNFKCTPNNFLRGTGCPKCNNIVSKPEIEVQNFVKYLGYNILTNKRNIINPKELDIYIPELQKAIEFNGTYYHYGSKFIPRKHSEKSNLCKELGIRLLHVREDLWKSKKEHMKQVIQKFLESGR